MALSAYRQAHALCGNHPGVPSARTCRKCDLPLCEPCCAFVVNDDVWCDSCGGELEGEGRSAQVAGRLSLLVGLGVLAAIVAGARLRWGREGLTVACFGMLVASVVLAQFLRVQRLRSGPRVVHAPRIHRRKAGDALPRPWAFAGRPPDSR